MKYADLIDPYVDFAIDAYEASQVNRLSKYDHFYKTFDDLLYCGRNRSERIVFEWLTPEEKAVAMVENVTTIDSIHIRE